MVNMEKKIDKIIGLLENLSATNNDELETANGTVVFSEENFKKMNAKQVFDAIIDIHDILCNHVYEYINEGDEELDTFLSLQFDAIYELGRKLNIK